MILLLVALVLLASLTFTRWGRDLLTRFLADGVVPVAGVRGEPSNAKDVRELRPYLLRTPSVPRGEIWLARDQAAALPPPSGTEGFVGLVSCVLTPYRILPAHRGWELAFLPGWLPFLAGAQCEHGPDGHAAKNDGLNYTIVPETDLERAIAAKSPALEAELLRAEVWAIDFTLDINHSEGPRLRIKTVENSQGIRFVPVFTNAFFAQVSFPGEVVRKVPLTMLAEVLGAATVVINPAGHFEHPLGPEELKRLRPPLATSEQGQ